jgi:2-amino-4-hydroxy-6-hydroxymethyldihydropteridine diphosphokinase
VSKLNAFASPETLHRAYLCLGSNIRPEENLRAAVKLLREQARVEALSMCWETPAYTERPGESAPNFLNAAVCILTPKDQEAIRAEIIAPIEHALGRVRTADKYAPRTIDLDLTLYDSLILDLDLWGRAYLALTFSELLPRLPHPRTGESLEQAARRLGETHLAVPRPEVLAGA